MVYLISLVRATYLKQCCGHRFTCCISRCSLRRCCYCRFWWWY